MENKIDTSLPDIDVSYGPKLNEYGEECLDKSGNVIYKIAITGFKEHRFSKQARQELDDMKAMYADIAKKRKLKKDEVRLFKKRLELWAREKIDNGEIVKYKKD